MLAKIKPISLLPAVPARPNLHHQIAGKIGMLITQGVLVPGSVLPNEASLGNSYGVSRTVLREAIKVLASKGLVEVRRKTGTQVRPHSDWNVLDREVLSWLFSGTGVPAGLNDLTEVRKIIEPASAKMAAERASVEDLAEIEKAFSDMQLAINHPPSSVEADLQFHLAILKAAHNVFMRPFGALIQTALRASFRLTSSDFSAFRKTLKLHKAVMEAILAGNGEDAAHAMSVMLGQTAQDISNVANRISTTKHTSKTSKHSKRR